MSDANTPAAAAAAPALATPRAYQVKCPACRQLTHYAPSNPWRPFCSARCKGVDLGAWADENYRVAVQPSPDDLLG